MAGATTEPPALGGPECPWPELSGHRLLGRRLESVTISNATVRDVVGALVDDYGIPLSFIEHFSTARVTVNFPSCTLQQLLDAIVASVPGYRYDFIGPHLVLYSTDPAWRVRIEHLDVPAWPRFNALYHLVDRLRRLVPPLANLGFPRFFGNPEANIFVDPVHLHAPATVVELFTQILGKRISVVFRVITSGDPPPGVAQITTAKILTALEVTAPKTTLHQNGEAVQLRVTGVLRDGTRQELTSPNCGTRYLATTEKIQVSSDGLVTAVEPGRGRANVYYENMAKIILFNVIPAGKQQSGVTADPPARSGQ